MNRQRAKELPFPTLRFLKISVQKTRRRKRIHDVLLMLLRAAVLLLVAAGLARPTVTSFGALWGNAGTAAVIVLDNSASMGMIDGDRPRFETASAAAAQILDQLGDGDQVALLPTCGPAFPDAGQARPHAGLRPPDARPMPRQLRAGRPDARSCNKPASCWPNPTPRTSRFTS